MSTARRRQLPANGLQLIGDIVPGLSLRVDIENRFQNSNAARLELTFSGGINDYESANDKIKKNTYQAITNLIEKKLKYKNNVLKNLEKDKFNKLLLENNLDKEDAKNLIKKLNSEKNKIKYTNFKEKIVGNDIKIFIEDFEVVEEALKIIIEMRQEFLIWKRIEEGKPIIEGLIKIEIEKDRCVNELRCFKTLNFNEIHTNKNYLNEASEDQAKNIENRNTNPKVICNDSNSTSLWNDIKSTLSQLSSSNPSLVEKNNGLKKIIKLAAEGNTMDEVRQRKLIRKECKIRSEFCNRFQEYTIPNFFDLKNARDPRIDLLYRSVAILDENDISRAWMGKNITTLEQWMIAQQKLDVILEINAEISRLQSSFGDEHLLLEKIAAYESLKHAIRNSDINESIQDIFKKDIIIGIETILNKKRFFTSSTSGKKLQEFKKLPDVKKELGLVLSVNKRDSLSDSSTVDSPSDSSTQGSPMESRRTSGCN